MGSFWEVLYKYILCLLVRVDHARDFANSLRRKTFMDRIIKIEKRIILPLRNLIFKKLFLYSVLQDFTGIQALKNKCVICSLLIKHLDI